MLPYDLHGELNNNAQLIDFKTEKRLKILTFLNAENINEKRNDNDN